MAMRRVVVTGLGAVSPYGVGTRVLWDGLESGRSAVRGYSALSEIEGLRPRIAGIVGGVDEKAIPRKLRRSMSAMSVYAVLAGREALDAAAMDEDRSQGEAFGLFLGSTTGSPQWYEDFFRHYFVDGLSRIKSTHFFKIMNHSAAANVAQALGMSGRVFAPSAACSTGGHALAMAYEAIAFGRIEAALCGGTEEYHPLATATFDILDAASHAFNDEPERASRPFDAARDGIVCSEGAGLLVLESLESARGRGAPILAEILGVGMNTDCTGIAHPSPESLAACMRRALHDANVAAEEIAAVNAHATGTIAGDASECRAVAEVFGGDVPVGSYKGHLGHTLAASGSLECAATITAMSEGRLIANCNLDDVDAECRGVNLVRRSEDRELPIVMKNSFGLGGVNCSIVISKWS